VQPHSRDLRPRKTLSWSSLPLQSRTASRLPALRCRRTHLRGRSVLSSPGIASPGVLSPLEHIDVGCPSSHPPRPLGHEDLAAAAGKVRVTRPSPVPSSGFLPLSTDLAALAARTFACPHLAVVAATPFAVAPRRFAALFHAARAHWSRPSELSLPEEPYPLSRALSPLWVRADRPTARRGPRVSRLLSPVAPTSRRGSPEGSPDWKAVTKVPWSR